jgi:chromosome segregation ATPase
MRNAPKQTELSFQISVSCYNDKKSKGIKMRYLLLCLLLASCTIVRVYDMKKFNKGVRKNIGQMDTTLNKMSEDIKFKNSVASTLSRYKSEPGLKKDLNELLKLRSNTEKEIKSFKNYFNGHPLSKKKKVKSTDKSYKDVEPYRDNLETRVKNIQNSLNAYTNKSNKLNDVLRSKKIYKVPANKVNQDTDQALKKFRASVNKARVDINTAKSKVAKSRLSSKDKKEKNSILDQMNGELNAMEREYDRFLSFYQKIQKEVKGKKEVIVVPGMASHDYIQKVQSHGKAIQAHVNRYNSLGKKLQD